MSHGEAQARPMTGRRWWVRRGGRVRGPWPRAVLEDGFLLGRLRAEDEVSEDGQHWRTLSQTPPFAALTRLDPESLARLRAQRDERGIGDRRGHAAATRARLVGERRRKDRRARESVAERRRRERRAAALLPLRERESARPSLVVAGAVALVVVLALWLAPEVRRPAVDCAAPPTPGVVLDGCDLEGRLLTGAPLAGARLRNARLRDARLAGSDLRRADLAYADLGDAVLREADLSSARLRGASLRGADLARATLRAADLRGADLRGATLAGAELDDARLDGALWTDGRGCRVPSRGACR